MWKSSLAQSVIWLIRLCSSSSLFFCVLCYFAFVIRLVGRIIFRTFPIALVFGLFLIVGRQLGWDLGIGKGVAADVH